MKPTNIYARRSEDHASICTHATYTFGLPQYSILSIFSIFRPTPNDSISADSPMKQPRTKNAVLAQQVSRSKRANSKTVGENIGGEIFQPKWIRKAYQRNCTHSVALASFPGSPPLRTRMTFDRTRIEKSGGEPGTFYHVSDVTGWRT